MLQHKSLKKCWNIAKNLNLGQKTIQNTPKMYTVRN